MYIKSHPESIEEIPHYHNIKSWRTFLPPLYPFQIKKQRLLGSTFKSKLLKSFRDGNVTQFDQISILLGKIITLSLFIQILIDDILQAQEPLLTNAAGAPFLENNCCNEGNKNTLLFLIEQKSTISDINQEVKKLNNLYEIAQNLIKASLLYDNKDTHFIYPQLQYEFDEETIYRAFIFYCKLDTIVPAHSSLQAICLNKDTQLTINDTFTEKMLKLKEEGKSFSATGLNNLLRVVGRENIIDIDIEQPIIGNRDQLRHVLEGMQNDDNDEFQMLINKLLANDDTYNSIESPNNFNEGPADELRNYIAECGWLKKKRTLKHFYLFFVILREVTTRQFIF